MLRYLNCCPETFSHVEKRLDTKAKVDFNINDVGKRIIAIHILSNISRSEGNETMEFGQLVTYKLRNIFLEKSYTKCGG